MKLNELTSNERELLLFMKGKQITFRDQRICISYPSFWFATRKLKDFGLITNSKGVWKLTEKGESVSECLKKIEDLL
jgi:predicted transcriptional regulator